MHFSLNPSPEDRLSEAQLTQLAAEFMERMGYGRQPYVVFLHEDIAQRHMRRLGEGGQSGAGRSTQQRTAARHGGLQGVGTQYDLHVPEDGSVQNRTGRIAPGRLPSGSLKHQLRNVVMTLKQQYGLVPRGVQYAARTLRPRGRDPRRRARS